MWTDNHKSQNGVFPSVMNSFVVWYMYVKVKVKSLSHVQLFATPWTVAYQAPPSMGFSRQGYWSRLLFPSAGGSARPRAQTRVSRTVGKHFYCLRHQGSLLYNMYVCVCIWTLFRKVTTKWDILLRVLSTEQ